MVTTLFTNIKILLRSEVIDVSMCWPFDFSIVILGSFLTLFTLLFAINIEIWRLKAIGGGQGQKNHV